MARPRLAGEPPPLAGAPPPQRRFAPTLPEPGQALSASLARGGARPPALAGSRRYPPAAEPKTTSRYFGVTWNQKRQKWCAQYQTGGAKRTVYCDEEEEAARGYDGMMRAKRPGPPASLVRSAAGRLLRFNFPTDQERAAASSSRARARAPDPAPAPARAAAPPPERPDVTSGRKRPRDENVPWSSYYGVTWHKTKRKWQVRIRHKPGHGSALGTEGVSKFVGSFGSEIEAARAYDEAARSVYGEAAHGWSAGGGRGCKRIVLNFPTEAEQARLGQERLPARTRRRSTRAHAPDESASLHTASAQQPTRTVDEDEMLSSLAFAGSAEVEEAPLQAPAATVPPASPQASEALINDGSSLDGRAAAGVQLHPFSSRFLDGGFGGPDRNHHQQQQEYEQAADEHQRQMQRQQLYLLRTALMIGGQELYAQVHRPQGLQEEAAEDIL